MNDRLIGDFIETWGIMGEIWGISRSVARVHGLLIITDRAWCIDEIVERLGISKSNVSTSLKELRSWDVVRKTSIPGDRREFYTSKPDAWEMLFNIMRQRKKREFDPVLSGVAKACDRVANDPSGIAIERLEEIRRMLDTFGRLAEMALASESQVKSMLSYLVDG